MKTKRLIGISGSLRQASYNTMALRLVVEQLPGDVELEQIDWRAVPAFDADVLAGGFPPLVAEIRARIAAGTGS